MVLKRGPYTDYNRDQRPPKVRVRFIADRFGSYWCVDNGYRTMSYMTWERAMREANAWVGRRYPC